MLFPRTGSGTPLGRAPVLAWPDATMRHVVQMRLGMALKRSKARTGTVVVLEHTSQVLKGNPLGDPHVRKVAVWLPPSYDQATVQGRSRTRSGKGSRFPVLYDLVGFTGSGLAHVGWKAFSENVPERAARLLQEKKIG